MQGRPTSALPAPFALLLTTALLLTATLATPATAALLPAQPPSEVDTQDLGGLISGASQELQQADDFALESPPNSGNGPPITKVIFWGFYEDPAEPASLPTDDFTLRIFEDAGGLPAATPEVELAGLAVFRQIADFVVTPSFLGERQVYRYEVEFSAPIQLAGNQTYHLSVLNDVTDRDGPNDDNWFWMRSNRTFDTGRSFRTIDGEAWAGLPNDLPDPDDPINNPPISIAGDLAFVLIPEPASAALGLLSAAALIGCRRRQKR